MMRFFSKKKTVAVHDGSFHTDDVFACAALALAHDGHIAIVRTRDMALIEKADIVVDVGSEYDEARERFDHHQIGGAGARANGVPYASFGLVWKKYGPQLCGSHVGAEKIDLAIVAPIDGPDNGVATYAPVFSDVGVYSIHGVVGSFLPTWKELDTDIDSQFLKAVELAKELLAREIKKTKDYQEAERIVCDAYGQAADKRIVIVPAPIGRMNIVSMLMQFSEPLFAVYPDREAKTWSVVGILKQFGSFEIRRDLPLAWAGLQDKELQKITGVEDAIFSHTKRFLVVAKSQAGALALAKLALND